jgi:hypothetical protein
MAAHRPLPIDPNAVRASFRRGKSSPRGVVWFGLSDFWGHLRHFLASAIATDDVDSRDWMTPDTPDDLCWRVARELGAQVKADTLTQCLERDVWIDYVSDTGDDLEISQAMARLIFAPYELPDPEQPEAQLLAPRGDILLFGGDTAYPVATVDEVNNRVLVPFNRHLQHNNDDANRVVMGIPGNHDWYDGLDGFARLFRRRFEDEGKGTASLIPVFPSPLEHAADWTRQFIRGGQVQKPKRLVLDGYTAVQNASYFILPLSPDIHLCAVDRQLKVVDYRQKHFVTTWQKSHPRSTPWLIVPDPVHGFCQPRPSGQAMVDALDVRYGEWPSFVLAGDIHHYQRFMYGKTLNVIAGGGGAFLHSQPINNRDLSLSSGDKVARHWPSTRQCRRLLWQVPLQIMSGRAGFIPHLVLLAVFTPMLTMRASLHIDALGVWSTTVVLFLVLWPLLAFLGGVRRSPRKIVSVALVFALAIALLPLLAYGIFAQQWLHDAVTQSVRRAVRLAFCVFTGSFLFGAYLACLTWLGLEHTQAFTSLKHPGFKHFLRLRVRKGGKHVDGWCLGLTDPLAPEQEPQLVDSFTWRVG